MVISRENSSRLSAEDVERARTWNLAIAQTLLDAQPRVDGEESRFSGQGGLSIKCSGAWYSFSESKGGLASTGLVKHLRPTENATAWVAAWLSAHPGTGSCAGESDEADGEAGAFLAAEILAAAVSITQSDPAETYLRSRGLEPPYPDCLRYLENARVGEHGLVGVLTAHSRVVGVQVGYLTPDGRKSLVIPQRRRFNLETAKGAVFSIQSSIIDPPVPIVFAEGLEDGLSLRGLCAGSIYALPGIGALQHLEAVQSCVVFRDGDGPGTAADKSLIKGIDNLLLQGVAVQVTPTTQGQDANLILQNRGMWAVKAVLEAAAPAELSFDGDVRRLGALIDPLEHDRARKAIATKHKVLTATVDKAERAIKPRRKVEDDGPNDPPWEDTIDLAVALDAAVKQLGRYIKAAETTLATIAVWAAHTHVLHNSRVRLDKTPRLALQSKTEGCGKTTALEIVCQLSSRGVLRSSYTPATIMRTMGSSKRTYCLDEADRQLHDDAGDMLAILDCGDRRSTALVERAVKDAEGRWTVETFDVFGAVALSGIDELPRTLQDRSIRIFLTKALTQEIADHLRDGRAPELDDIRRHFAAWGAERAELPDPTLPEVLTRQAGRTGDNWRPLIAIADSAGGKWPELLRRAVLQALESEQRPSLVERVLLSIRNAFAAQAENDDAKEENGDTSDRAHWPDRSDRLTTKTLIARMLDDETEEWSRANRGKPISEYWLRTHLRGLLEPPHSVQWECNLHGSRHQPRGYLRSQFERAWQAHLARIPHTRPNPDSSEGSEGSCQQPDKQVQSPLVTVEPVPSDAPTDPVASVAASEGTGTAENGRKLGLPSNPSDPSDQSGWSEASAPLDPEALLARPARPDVLANPRATSNGKPNGSHPEASPSVDLLMVEIRKLRDANPTWSLAKLARQSGMPKSVVEKALAE